MPMERPCWREVARPRKAQHRLFSAIWATDRSVPAADARLSRVAGRSARAARDRAPAAPVRNHAAPQRLEAGMRPRSRGPARPPSDDPPLSGVSPQKAVDHRVIRPPRQESHHASVGSASNVRVRVEREAARPEEALGKNLHHRRPSRSRRPSPARSTMSAAMVRPAWTSEATLAWPCAASPAMAASMN